MRAHAHTGICKPCNFLKKHWGTEVNVFTVVSVADVLSFVLNVVLAERGKKGRSIAPGAAGSPLTSDSL